MPVFITVSQLLDTERQVEAVLGSTHSPVNFFNAPTVPAEHPRAQITGSKSLTCSVL